MKLWSNYRKELKIASRGFYFYLELVMAAVLLAAILLFVPAEVTYVSEEAVFAEFPRETLEQLLLNGTGEQGRYERAEDTQVRVRPDSFTYYDEQTGAAFPVTFDDKKTLELETWYYFDAASGKHTKTLVVVQSLDDLLRVAKTEKWLSTVIRVNDAGQPQYRVLLFGTESERYRSMVAAAMSAGDTLTEVAEGIEVRALGAQNVLSNRASYLPLVVVIMNGLMGLLMVTAYLTIDKASGLIRAMAVTPVHTRSYLLSKVLVVVTTSLLSSLAVTVPVMGLQPNYLLFIPAAALVSVFSCTLGLWLASFFEDLKSAFGVLFLIMAVMMLPAMSSIIPGFAPLWLRLMPTYPMLRAVTQSLLPRPDVWYTLLVLLGMAAVSAVLLYWSEHRYRKSLGV